MAAISWKVDFWVSLSTLWDCMTGWLPSQSISVCTCTFKLSFLFCHAAHIYSLLCSLFVAFRNISSCCFLFFSSCSSDQLTFLQTTDTNGVTSRSLYMIFSHLSHQAVEEILVVKLNVTNTRLQFEWQLWISLRTPADISIWDCFSLNRSKVWTYMWFCRNVLC